MYTNWQSLGEIQYRKWEVYGNLEWGFEDLDSCIVTGAQYGGPVAVVRDEKKLSEAEQSLTPTMRIFSSSSKLLAEIPWTHHGLVGLGWTDEEYLCCGFVTGDVLMYDINGNTVNSFNVLGDMAGLNLHTVLEVQVWGNGVVALCDDMQIYGANGIHTKQPRIYTMATSLTREEPYTSMAILPPQYTSSGAVEVILGTRTNSVVIVDENGAEDQQAQNRLPGDIIMIAVSPHGRFLACFTSTGMLTVMSTSFTTKFLDFDTSTQNRPLGMLWCGEDCILLHWRGKGLCLVGPYGDFLRFPYQDNLALVQEADCCRIFTPHSCEILQRVPPSTEAIGRIGCIAPEAMLYDAAEAFEEGDPKADEAVREMALAAQPSSASLSGEGGDPTQPQPVAGHARPGEVSGGQLAGAVVACLAAAAAEFQPESQKKMLKAASYGKGFLRDYDAGEFVDTCRKLRVLNHVRQKDIGLPLTIEQYNRLTPEALIQRLLTRKHHFLALKICEYLKMQQDHVLVHWACEEIRSAKSKEKTDEDVRDTIRQRLESCQQVSYAQIAAAADQVGRRRLATMLLDFEPSPGKQIPLLLSMGEEELALQKAINSDETDYIYLAIFHMEQSGNKNFYKRVFSFPQATNLLKTYYKHRATSQDNTNLHRLCLKRTTSAPPNSDIVRQSFHEAAAATVKRAYQQHTLADRLIQFRDAAKLYSSCKDLAFQKQMTEEQIELMDLQQDLEKRTGHPVFLDMSVSDTIYNLICLGSSDSLSLSSSSKDIDYMAEATKIQNKFKVPKERFWHLKIRALASSGQWERLKYFANEKKSPIGYRPFAAACIQHGQPQAQTELYIQKIPQLEERFDLFVEIKSFEKATECAAKLKDIRRLLEVASLTPDPSLKKRINEMAKRMK